MIDDWFDTYPLLKGPTPLPSISGPNGSNLAPGGTAPLLTKIVIRLSHIDMWVTHVLSTCYIVLCKYCAVLSNVLISNAKHVFACRDLFLIQQNLS